MNQALGTYTLGTPAAEAGGSQGGSQPGLHRDNLCIRQMINGNGTDGLLKPLLGEHWRRSRAPALDLTL